MAKKQTGWKTKGMNRDLSVSAFNPEFAFENMNLRLSTNDGNTLLSWVNEKGPANIELYREDPHWFKEGEEDVEGRYTDAVAQTLPHGEGPAYTTKEEAKEDGWDWSEYRETFIEGAPIGTAVLNQKLVLFTAQMNHDRIYTLEYKDADKTQMLIIKKYEGDLGFSSEFPLETLVSYESERIQKVYWVDGKNQPRVINIFGDVSGKPNTFFDFIPTLQLQEEITVKKTLGGNGTFAPGVIQYAFTYYNKYGQESNIFYTTPLYYLSHRDRGASPEDKVDNAFRITVKNVDKNFDYLRIYSIQRTSINATPICKRIQDVYLDDSYDTTVQEEYAYSNTSPSVTKNGAPKAPDITNVTRTIFGQSGIPCIGYSSDDIEVHAGDNIIAFGVDATSDSIIWVTTNKITHNGITAFFVVESPDDTDNDQTEPVTLLREPLSFIDNGTSGDSVDPIELLYKGGEPIIANTIEQKDGTLFLGNFKNDRESLNDIKDSIVENTIVSSESSDPIPVPCTRTIIPTQVSIDNYPYSSQLTATNENGTTNVPCGGFKKGDYYRCGVQFQHKTGKWSEPIFISDVEVKGTPSINGSNVILPVLQGQITDASTIGTLVQKGYKKVRPVVVFPELKDRITLCQGVVAPTVYTKDQRGTDTGNTSSLYA